MENFNWQAYIANYKDLRDLNTKTKAYNHYLKYGKAENRSDSFTYRSHPYYTHQPFLKEILKRTTGNVLECGCGYGSTPFIKEILAGTGRKHITLESDVEWLQKFVDLTDTLHHIDATIEDTDANAVKWVEFIENNLKDITFDVVFIDSNPWLSRKHIFDYFKNKVTFIVIHDFDYFPNNNIIGKTVSKQTFQKGNMVCEKIEIVAEGTYKLCYPPFQFFVGETGPPTFIYTNTISQKDLDDLETKVLENYYN